ELDGREMRRRIARALFGWAKKAGVVSESDRQVVRDAAALFAEVGDHAGAAECHELIGDEMAAAEAYQRAGDVEKLESVLAREETCEVVLRDAGISRRHAEIVRGESFVLHDLESKNGTLLGGPPMAAGGSLPLVGAGELGLDEVCVLAFEASDELLRLRITRGL